MCDKSEASILMKIWLWFNKKNLKSSTPITFKATVKVGL